MKWNKANFAGLTSPGQRSEMKSILAGTWPPLKPLPVFKYETEEYRATISFDRKRGEWVCRETSLPSNEVQELRGGLREITMALPHGEAEIFTDGAEPPDQELEKDAHRRLQAMREWREKYGNGALYFELRDLLSEGQRTELDDSLRLSLTARQLQFNSKNVANVFDDLSIAGGRFAALIEFAKQNKANRGIAPHARGEGAVAEAESAVPEAEHAPDIDNQSQENTKAEFGGVLTDNDPVVPHQETPERCTGADEFPALSIKNVFPEPDQPHLADSPERMARTASQPFEIETSDIADEEVPSLTEYFKVEHSQVEHSHQEERHSPVFTSFAAGVPTGQPFADRTASSSSRFPALKISAFQVNVFALLLLFAVTSFTVGLTVGRGPLGKRLREAPKSLLATDAKPPALPDATPDASDESTPRTPPPPVASSDDVAGINKPADAVPAEESKESPRISDVAEGRSTDADSSPVIESKPTVKPELNPEHSGAIEPVVRNISPPQRSKRVHRTKSVRSIRSTRRNPAPFRLTSTTAATPHLTRPSTILVTLPGQESQPIRVKFPEKAIAATSSFAMTSQLSVLVSPELELTVAQKSSRLEAGELVSFGWPRYPKPGDRYGLAETIRVRATIGQLGQVQDVKFLSGSASLLPATREAIRQWRYTPTLLDKRPVQAEQDVTIEFRPPQYSSRLSTPHPSHN